MRHRLGQRFVLGAAMLLVFVAALGMVAPPASADGAGEHGNLPPGWVLYDGGALLELDSFAGAVPLELAISLFASGSPAVTWRTDVSPTVEICTQQADRPSWLTAQDFRASVTRGVAVWSEVEAAVGFDYVGDCTSGTTWRLDNSVNEIGWDDSRNAVRSPAAGVTFGSWMISASSRDFVETDIVIDHQIDVPAQCFDSVVAHELGHALGLGHSTELGDLMYPSFDPGNLATCPGRPTASEVSLMRSLYGTNRMPVITAEDQQAAAGTRTLVSVSASDPDGDRLTYSWTQTSGPTVSFSGDGHEIAFDAPEEPDATLVFRVTARDQFLHAASTEVRVTLIVPDAPPSGSPGLEVLELSEDGQRLRLLWSEVAGATDYRYCTTPSGSTLQSCVVEPSPSGEITWDTVLGAPVENEPLRVFTSDTRAVTMQACNTEGCTEDTRSKIHAGGLRWVAYDVDYDFFGMTYDIPAINFRFTIAVVQNLTGATRSFELFTGQADGYQTTRIENCGRLAPGALCIGLLGPQQRGHATYITVRSEKSGTPAFEHRIRVR